MESKGDKGADQVFDEDDEEGGAAAEEIKKVEDPRAIKGGGSMDWREVLFFVIWMAVFMLQVISSRSEADYIQSQHYIPGLVAYPFQWSPTRELPDVKRYSDVNKYFKMMCTKLFDTSCKEFQPGGSNATASPTLPPTSAPTSAVLVPTVAPTAELEQPYSPCGAPQATSSELNACAVPANGTFSRIGPVVFHQTRVTSQFSGTIDKDPFEYQYCFKPQDEVVCQTRLANWTSEYTSSWGAAFVGNTGVHHEAYPTDGYYQMIPHDSTREQCLTIVDSLFNPTSDSSWIDPSRKTLEIDMMVVLSGKGAVDHSETSAGLSSVTPMRIYFEFARTGGVRPGYTYGRYIRVNIMMMSMVYIIMLGFLYNSISRLRKERMNFFRDFWNLLDTINYVMYIIAVIFFVFYKIKTIELSDLSTSCAEPLGDLITQNDEIVTPLDPQQYSKMNLFFATLVVSDAYAVTFGINCIFMTVKMLRYFYFIPYLTLGIYTLMDVGRLVLLFLFVFVIIHSGFSLMIYFIFYDSHFVFSTFLRTFGQLLYIVLKAVNAWEPLNQMQEPNRSTGLIVIGLYVFFMVYIMLNIFVAMVLISYARVRPNFKNEFIENLILMWRDMREKVHTCKEFGMYLRGALLKNDSNFYFAEYDRKKAGEDGDETPVPDDSNTTISRNPIAEEQEPLSPRPAAAQNQNAAPKQQDAEIEVEHGAAEIIDENRGLLTLRQTERLRRDQDLQLNQARIEDTLNKAQNFVDAMTILGATLERSTLSAKHVMDRMPETNRQITDLSIDIIDKLFVLQQQQPKDFKGLNLGSPLSQKVGKRGNKSESVRSNRKNGRPRAESSESFANPMFDSAKNDPMTEYGGDTTVADTVMEDNDSTSGLSQWLQTETTAPAPARRKPPKAVQKLHNKLRQPVYTDNKPTFTDESTEGTELTDYTDTSTRSNSAKTDISKWLRSAKGKNKPRLSGVPEGDSEISNSSRSRSMTQPSRQQTNRSNKDDSYYDDESTLDDTMSDSRASRAPRDDRSLDWSASDTSSRAPKFKSKARKEPKGRNRSSTLSVTEDDTSVTSPRRPKSPRRKMKRPKSRSPGANARRSNNDEEEPITLV